MTTPASGDADSPMAKRGCVPRSSSATRRPRRRATIASSEPPNPEPMIARSASSGAITHDGRRNALGPVDETQPLRAVRGTVAGEETFDVPQVGEYATQSDDDTVFHDGFERGEPRSFRGNRFHDAVAAAGRNDRTDR